MAELEQFRQQTRAWLEANCPASMREPAKGEEDYVWGGTKFTFKHPDQKVWLDRMAEKGWTAPTWPAQYGGGGLSAEEENVLREEMSALNCRSPLISFGISMLGPVLLEYGNEAQKERFIPPIVRGETRWCQGYSEPGAGSDLAGLQTSAEDKGDHYLVNGQKVWTSYADQADWIFCLVRTDKTVKQGGISFLLFDMNSPGVEARPIKLISGYSPFCETFFTDVKVPKEQLVGELNGGLTIAKRLLQHERSMISNVAFTHDPDEEGGRSLVEMAKQSCGLENGKIADGGLRDAITSYQIKVKAFALTMARARDGEAAGNEMGAVSSMFKYYGTELNKHRLEVCIGAMGNQELGWEGDAFDPRDLALTKEWLRSKGNSIEGGTSEVQLNVIAKRVLGLPGEGV